MVPSLQHLHPLAKELSTQPHGPFVLVLQGQTTKKYFYLRAYTVEQTSLRYQTTLSDAWGAIPIDYAWVIYPSDALEYPTIEALARQESDDQKALGILRKELQGNGEGTQVIMLTPEQAAQLGGGIKETVIPEWYAEQQQKQYL